MQYLEPIYKSLLIPPSQENADDARRLLILPVQHTKTLLYALLDATLVFNGEKAAQQSTFLVQKEVLISQYSLNELARICAQISAIWNTKAEIVVEQVKDDNFLFTFTPH